MSALSERLEILKSCREDWVNAFAAGEDGPFMIQDLANIQLCVMAFEAVVLDETISIIKEDAQELRAKFRSAIRAT